MTSVLRAWGLRLDLEGRFLLWLLALQALGCAAYVALHARSPSVMLAVGMASAVSMIVAVAAHYALFTPLRRLVAMARRVGAGDFSQRLRLSRRDDIGRLALEMDVMCDQLDAARLASEAHVAALEQLRHSDRVATLGRLASSVAHELGNPLNVIELRAQLITTDVTTLEQARHNANLIVEQTRRMTRIIDDILSFARVRTASKVRLDLAAVLRKAVALCDHTSRANRAVIELVVPDEAIEIDGDANTLLQIIVNLVMNGAQAMPGGGALRIATSDVHRAPVDDPQGPQSDYVCIEVSDHGQGMSADVLAKAFRPFFSTKDATGGTGLGLSVAQGIAHDHHGWISATSEVGRGSSFKVFLPKPGGACPSTAGHA